MLYLALLTVACLLFVSSGQSTGVDNRVNDTQELAASTSTVLNADTSIYQTLSAIQSSAPEISSAVPVATSAPAGELVATSSIVPITMTMTTIAFSVATSDSATTTSIPPVTTSIPPVTTSTPPVTTSIPPVTTSIPPVTTSIPTVTTTIPSVMTSIPPVTTSIPTVTTTIPSVMTIVPTTTAVNVSPMITKTPPIIVSTPAPNSVSSTTTSMPLAKSSSSLYILPQSSFHEVLLTSSSQIQATYSHPLPPPASAPSQTTAVVDHTNPSSIQTQANITPWQVSVAVLAVLTGVLLLTTILLSIALCVAICRFRARNLTYTIKNPETKESKYWIETKSTQSEDKVSPIGAEEGHKVWYTESATAFPVFPMAHLAATRDPTDSNPSVQTFRLARAYKQSPGSSAPSRPAATAETVPVSASAPSTKMETDSDEASNRTDGAVAVGGEVVGRAIIVPTTPTSENDLSKAKKRRPPPLKPIGVMSAEPQEGTYTKQGGSSSHNPTTPGSCSVQKSQVSELMKEYSAMLQGRQNTT